MNDTRKQILEVLYDLANEPAAFFDPRKLGSTESEKRAYGEEANALLEAGLVSRGADPEDGSLTDDLRITREGVELVEENGWRGLGVDY